MSSKKYIQVIGFVAVVMVVWKFVGPELAAVTATAVAIWEFLNPSRIS